MKDKDLKDFIKDNYASSPSTFIITELIKIYLVTEDESLKVEILGKLIETQKSIEQLSQSLY